MEKSRQSRGIVFWFNDAKGWGLIRDDIISDYIFVHYSAIQKNGFKTLIEGERVRYKIVSNAKGPQAFEVFNDDLEYPNHWVFWL